MELLENLSSAEEQLVIRAAAAKLPIGGSVELTPLCNMNCDMCYVRLSKTEMESRGKLLSGDRWLELGRQMARMGTLFLQLTGGEPLLHPDFKQIYLGLRKMGMILTINTNGTLIDEAWADFFAKNKPRRINITLYGASEATYERLCHYPGGFHRAVRAVKLLRTRGVDVKLNGSMTPANAADTEQILQIARELDVPCKLDAYMYPAARERSLPFNRQARFLPEEAAAVRVGVKKFGKTETEIRDIANRYFEEMKHPASVPEKGLACRAGSSSFMLNWQGQLRPCILVNTPSADALELGFAQAWQQIVRACEQITMSPKCAGCARRGVCLVCGACAQLETGDYGGTPEYMCRYVEETERLLREWVEACHE